VVVLWVFALRVVSPDDPRAVRKHTLSHCSRMNAAKVTEGCNFMEWRAYVIKQVNSTVKPDKFRESNEKLGTNVICSWL